MTSASPSQFLTASEFARAATISLATVRRRIKDGTLPFWQPGGSRTAMRIPRTALDAIEATAPPSRDAIPESQFTKPTARSSQPHWMRRGTK